ncbi:hypothetical protein Tco_0472444 [Tanacetum coccineum]
MAISKDDSCGKFIDNLMVATDTVHSPYLYSGLFEITEEDLFKMEMTKEMIEVDQAIRSPKSPHWSPPMTFLDYSTDVFYEHIRGYIDDYKARASAWDNVQAMIDADYQMAQQMQAEEQEKPSIEEKSKLFVQLLEARKKHFAAMRAQEERNKPPTKAQKRNTMSTYLKNMAGYKHNQLKNKSFDDIQKLFDKAIKRANTFVDMDTEFVEVSEVRAEGSETRVEGRFKRAGEELEQESSKRGNTLRSSEDRLKLQELMELCTNLQNRVIDLEKIKTVQAQKITCLKLRVKKLEKIGGSRTHKLKRLYKVGRSTRIVSSDEASLGDQEDASKQGRKIDDIDKDAEITLVDETQGRYGDDIMFDVSDLAGEEVFVAEQGVPDSKKDDVAQVNTAATTISIASTIPVSAVSITDVEITLAQALAELKSAKPTTATSIRPKAKGLVIHEQEQAPTPIVSSQQPSQAKIQDKGKAKMIEPEPVKKLSKKDQLKLDEEVAQRLQAEFDEQERIEREKVEANIALKETWDDIQAKIKADQLLAERLQAREQEELTVKERAILFQQLLEKIRKHFAAKRADEKRNRLLTKAQQRSIMCTYLKNMEGWKPKDLKNKSFDSIQKLFDKAMKRVNTFVDMDTELVKESSKKAEAEIAQKSSLKRAGDELEQEIAVDDIPLATKPPSIVDWKIHKEGKKSYY